MRLEIVYDGTPEWALLPDYIKERKQPWTRKRGEPEVDAVPLTEIEARALKVAMWTRTTPNPIAMTTYLETAEFWQCAADLVVYLGKFAVQDALDGKLDAIGEALGVSTEEAEMLVEAWAVGGDESAELLYRALKRVA